MKRIPELFARFVVRKPWWLLVIALVVSAAAVPGVTMLETSSGMDTLISPNSKVYQDNENYEAQFGRPPITVLLTGDLGDIFSIENLAIISRFEREFSLDPRYRSVMGPVTALQEAADEANRKKQALETEVGLGGSTSVAPACFVLKAIRLWHPRALAALMAPQRQAMQAATASVAK